MRESSYIFTFNWLIGKLSFMEVCHLMSFFSLTRRLTPSVNLKMTRQLRHVDKLMIFKFEYVASSLNMLRQRMSHLSDKLLVFVHLQNVSNTVITHCNTSRFTFFLEDRHSSFINNMQLLVVWGQFGMLMITRDDSSNLDRCDITRNSEFRHCRMLTLGWVALVMCSTHWHPIMEDAAVKCRHVSIDHSSHYSIIRFTVNMYLLKFHITAATKR